MELFCYTRTVSFDMPSIRAVHYTVLLSELYRQIMKLCINYQICALNIIYS